MHMKPIILLAALLATPAVAQEFNVIESRGVTVRAVQHLALNPVLVRAVRNQNSIELDAADMNERDRQWRDSGETGLKWALQESPAGQLLRRVVDETGIIQRAYITDRRGANVAAYPPTSDYFHGDEEKWRRPFEDRLVHVAPADEDTGGQAGMMQLSVPLIHRGQAIGVLVVAVTAESIQSEEMR